MNERTKWLILKAAAAVLLIAAILKAWQLLTLPLQGDTLWTSRPLLIALVEVEFFLSLWLFSGLKPFAAWATTLACFCIFTIATFYRIATGAASCGCFGGMDVSPWVTLMAIDLPLVTGLFFFSRPTRVQHDSQINTEPESRGLISEQSQPTASPLQIPANRPLWWAPVWIAGIIIFLAGSTLYLALNKPVDVNDMEMPALNHTDLPTSETQNE